MNLREKLAITTNAIKEAADSDEVDSILQSTCDELIDHNIMGLELKFFVSQLHKELSTALTGARDFIEFQNIGRAIEYTEHLAGILRMDVYLYQLN